MSAKIKSHSVRLAAGLLSILRFSEKYQEPNPTVALYIKDDAIGDFLFGTAMIRELQSRYRDVYIVCSSSVRPIAELYGPSDKIYDIDTTKFDSKLSYRMDWARRLYGLKPKLVVTSSLRSSLADQIARLFSSTNTDVVSTDDPSAKKRRRSHLYTRLSAHPPDDQVDSRFLCGAHRKEHLLIEAAFETKLDPSTSRPYVPVEKLRSRKLPLNLGGRLDGHLEKFFCVLPSTGDSRRTYRRDHLIRLAARASERTGWPAVYLSAGTIPELNAATQSLGVIDLAGQTSLVESLSLIAQSQFTLTNETGLGHASWMMGRPTVMIMPGGNFRHFHANEKSLHAVYDMRECFDCHHRCRYKFDQRFPCIEEIPFEKIEAAITNILTTADSRH